MRRTNSVRGHRLYPSSPADAELVQRGSAVIGQFNEGMDYLYHERELTAGQRAFLDTLPPESNLSRVHLSLNQVSNHLWTLALDKQQALARGVDDGPWNTVDLTHRLNRCWRAWRGFKNQLNHEMGVDGSPPPE